MIIDVHGHPDWYGHDLNRTLENMAECNIDKIWMLSWECPAEEFNPSNTPFFTPLRGSGDLAPFSRCVSYVERAPEKFVLAYAPDPRRPDAIDRLSAAIEIHGVRVYGELKVRTPYDNPDVLAMFRFCGKKGLPVLLHMQYEIEGDSPYPRPDWYGGTIAALERAVAACPDTIFIGHAVGFWSHISNDDQCDKVHYPKGKVIPGGALEVMLRKYPNLYCDLSAGSGRNALTRDPEYTRSFFQEFQDQILYGRDSLDNELQKTLRDLSLSPEILEKVYSGNALKLVPL